MLHTGRCGSSVLTNMLKINWRTFWAGEIFEEYKYIETAEKQGELVAKVINSSRDSKPSMTYGFETKYLPVQHLSDNCIGMSIEDYLASLDALGFSHFILLHRQNYLRRYISALVGAQTKQWHSREQIGTPTMIAIDIEAFLKLCSSMDESYDRLTRVMSGNSLLLTYEDDIQNDPGSGYRKVCKFLGVADEAPEIKLRRTNPFGYDEMIENFAEVEVALKDTKYGWMLDD